MSEKILNAMQFNPDVSSIGCNVNPKSRFKGQYYLMVAMISDPNPFVFIPHCRNLQWLSNPIDNVSALLQVQMMQHGAYNALSYVAYEVYVV